MGSLLSESLLDIRIINKMSLEVTNKRLIEELKTVTSLLKMKIRVESSGSKDFAKLTTSLAAILNYEIQLSSQLKYVSDLESEVKQLRSTCEKFSELSESVSLIHSKYKHQIHQLTQENSKLSEENSNIRVPIPKILNQKP